MKNKRRIRFEKTDVKTAANTKFLSAFLVPFIWHTNPVLATSTIKLMGL